MKNTWLRRDEHVALGRGDKKLGCKVMNIKQRESSPPARPRTSPSSGICTSPVKASSYNFAIRKDMRSNGIRTPYRTSERVPFFVNSDNTSQRSMKRAKNLLEGVLKRDCTAHDGIPKPANHIVRKIENIKHPEFKRTESFPRFNFKNENFLSFGCFDTTDRPGWDESPVLSAENKKALQRKRKVRQMKMRLVEINVITNTVKDVLTAFLSDNKPSLIKDNMSFSVPIYLNNHEIHAWRTLSNLQLINGESFSLIHMEELCDICKSSGDDGQLDATRFRIRHPEIYHFVCYCNLLLGGTKSFSSAKFLLLRDISLLLNFVQKVNPLKVPLENLRAATTYRLREAKHLQQQQQQHQMRMKSTPGSWDQESCNKSATISSPNHSKKSSNPKKINPEKEFQPWDETISVLSCSQSKLTMFTTESDMNDTISKQSSKTSIFIPLPQKLSSLLARIILISAARTPREELLNAENNKSLPPQDLESLLLVKTEGVRIDEDAIHTVIGNSNPSFTRLPPPEDSKHDATPTGLFDSARRNSTTGRKCTLNQQLTQQSVLRRQSTLHNDGAASRAGRNPFYESRKIFFVKNSGDNDSSESAWESSRRKMLSAVRTSSICENFRNAQKLMREIHKISFDGGANVNEDNETSNDEDEQEEEEDEDHFDWSEVERDSFSVESGDEDTKGSFMRLLHLKSVELRQPLQDKIINTKSGQEEIENEDDEPSDNAFFLYADMMNEEESMELLSKSSNAVRAGVLGSLSSQAEEKQKQGKWKETKAEEQLLFARNIRRNKEYIDEVVRMYNLRAQVSPTVVSSKGKDFCTLWQEHLEKVRAGEYTEINKGKNSSQLSCQDRKVMSLLRTQEVKEDVDALRFV